MTKKYCKCKGGLVMLNLQDINATCPICNLPKKLEKGSRASNMLRFAKAINKSQKQDKTNG